MLLEAMALGTPVVSTAMMGTRDVLRHGEGALVVREDEAQFASAVAALLQDESLRTRLGHAGERYARQWSARATADRLMKFYGRVTAACAAARASARTA